MTWSPAEKKYFRQFYIGKMIFYKIKKNVWDRKKYLKTKLFFRCMICIHDCEQSLASVDKVFQI